VNGFVAAVHEGAFAVHVPVAPGETVLTATARTPAGATASHSVAVTLSETIAAALRALPGDGLAPLDVQFALDGVTPATITLDADGDGAADFVGSSVTGRPFPYPTPGLYFPRATVTDDRGNQVVLTTLVSVTSPAAFEARLLGLWTGFRARLRSGDVPGALEHLSPSIRPQFEDIFQSLAPALGAIAAGLPDIVPLDQADNLAEAALVSDDDGQPALYFIYFRRDGLGRWLIEEM
jgi:hypothetical protein